MNTQDRVDRALAKIQKKHKFTREQEGWLKLVRDHLAENLLIDEKDFKVIPFSRRGAWKKANTVFDGKLLELMSEINLAMVS